MRPRDKFYPANIERLEDWNIPRRYWLDREPGLSAMVRVKDEAEWFDPSIRSVLPWVDEIMIALQGVQSDGTDKIAERLRDEFPEKVIVYRYPFESLPNGPGHDHQRRGSVYERAYFYNWCQAKTRFSHAMKWDGDMVASDWLGDRVLGLMREHDVIRFRGLDIAGPRLENLSVKPRTACEPRVWRVSESTWFYSGRVCEFFTYGHDEGHAIPENDAFLHFKWAKDLVSAMKDWPSNWKANPHFRRIYNRRLLGRRFNGPWPSVIAPEVRKRRGLS